MKMAKRIVRSVLGVSHFKVGGIHFIRCGLLNLQWSWKRDEWRGTHWLDDEEEDGSAISIAIQFVLIPVVMLLAVMAVQHFFPWNP
jgi:hypothetical protein